MRINAKILGILVFLILFGGIAGTTLAGWWRTESSKTPARFAAGEAEGEYNPADIRGSYTFGDVNRVFGIPLGDLAAAFRLPAGTDTASYSLKNLETLYADLEQEIGTSSVRVFTALYKNLPYDLSAEETFLLPEAVAILKTKAVLSPEQSAYLDAHTVLSTGQPAAEQQARAAEAEHSTEDRIVSGKTSFQNLLDWGVSQADIDAVLGKPMPPAVTLIKDYATAQGLAFSTLKTDLQALVDKVKTP